MAVILYNTNRMFNSLWSESKLQGSVARDYSIFFWIVAFGAYLLSVTWADITNEAWVCEGACDTAEDEDTDEAYDLEGGEKFNPGIALKLMARAVPRHAWPFASIFLMQIGDMVADALRVVPYIKYKLLKRAKVASDASVEESLEPDDADLGAPAGWSRRGNQNCPLGLSRDALRKCHFHVDAIDAASAHSLISTQAGRHSRCSWARRTRPCRRSRAPSATSTSWQRTRSRSGVEHRIVRFFRA